MKKSRPTRSTQHRLVLLTGCLTLLAGCQTQRDEFATMRDRHWQAVERLPEEKKRRNASADHASAPPQSKPILPNGPLSLEAACAVAVRDNPDIHAAQARLDLALARVAEARSLYYPNLVATQNATRTFQTPANRNRLAAASTAMQRSASIPADSNSPPAVLALINAIRRPFFDKSGDGDTNSFSEHASALTSSWILFDGFVREAQLMASKYVYQASAEALVDAQRLVTRSVEAAYYQVQLAREQIRISQAADEFARDQYEETKKLQGAGRASAADVDNFRVRMLGAQAELSEANGLYEAGKIILAELMGIDGVLLPQDIEISPLAEETPEELAEPEVAAFLADGTRNRPDVRQLEELAKSEEENVRAAYGHYQPVLSMTGTWGFNRTSNMRYEVDDQSSAAGVELRWEIFTGGAREARILGAESMKSEAYSRVTRQRLAVESEVRRAVIDVKNSQEQIHLQRENVTTARENRRIVQAGYVAGKETLSRLNEAQRDFITTDANLALARIRLRQAWSDLRAAAAVDVQPLSPSDDVQPSKP